MKKLPKYLKEYFWDVEFEKMKTFEHPQFIIARLLEYGDREAITWMMNNFPREDIIYTLENSRELSQKSANFWALFLEVDRRKIKCLQKSFLEIRKKFWPY